MLDLLSSRVRFRPATKGSLQARLTVALVIALSSCTPLRIQYPLNAGEADWQTEGRSIQRDRVAPDAPLLLPLEEAWIYNAGAGFAESSPLVVDNTVFVGTRKGEVHVLGLTDGAQIGSEEFGRSIEGTPALDGQVLFVPNAWGKHVLSAFDLRSGRYLWRYSGVPIEAAVLLIGDVVVVGDVEGNVLAFEKTRGSIEWLFEFGELASILSDPVGIDDRRIGVADETGRIAVLDVTDGAQIWAEDLATPVEAGLSAGHGMIFVPTTRSGFLALRAEDGSLVWEYRAETEGVRFTSAAVTEDAVILGGTDGILRSLNAANGSTMWTFQTDGTIAAAPVVNGSLVFIGAMDEKVYAVHRENGSLQWEAPVRGRVKSSPAVRNGYLIVMSEPRYIYAFTNAANIQD